MNRSNKVVVTEVLMGIAASRSRDSMNMQKLMGPFLAMTPSIIARIGVIANDCPIDLVVSHFG